MSGEKIEQANEMNMQNPTYDLLNVPPLKHSKQLKHEIGDGGGGPPIFK